jgi:hypothetical protein
VNGKHYSSLLFGLLALSLVLFGIPLQAFAYHSGSESDLAISPELIALRNYAASSAAKLALNPELALLSSYRVSESGVLKVDSVRWSALGIYYAKLVALRTSDADSARWAALGAFYRTRAAEADAARWAALGDRYAGSSLAANPELCYVRNYGDLADNPELLSLQQYKASVC